MVAYSRVSWRGRRCQCWFMGEEEEGEDGLLACWLLGLPSLCWYVWMCQGGGCLKDDRIKVYSRRLSVYLPVVKGDVLCEEKRKNTAGY